ncbi:MAG: dihydrolipoamide acetyltransferase family protein [Candidatus Poseidoniia archaeon]|nr:dihydrolipoamide acetyltransferase family protein [Candidatus Poseidoniia archaeon]
MGKYVFKLPDVGEGIVEGEIVDWKVRKGETVAEDQPLVDLMTDKATVAIPSPVSGKVLSTTGKPGDMVPVGAELIVFDVEGKGEEAEPKPEPEPEPAPEPAPADTPAPVPAPAAPAAAPTATGKRPLASPAVRRRAREAGVELAGVPGSGPAGRISHNDLDAFLQSGGRLMGGQRGQKRTGTTEIPVIGLRRKIAAKMAASKSRIPHFSYLEEVDITELESLRQHLNAKRSGDMPKLTYLPFLMQALVRTLQQHPECNALYEEERNTVVQHEAVHAGIATQTDGGLMVPVVRHAEARDVWDCANEMRRVSQAARDKTATSEELSGSTITITSLGALGGLGATPIINHPEVAIIGVHKAEERAVVRDGNIVVRRMMNLSGSFDHRVVDGYDGARMMQTLKQMLEHPATIFI